MERLGCLTASRRVDCSLGALSLGLSLSGPPHSLDDAIAVVAVAVVAVIISYKHAYEMVAIHSEPGLTGRLLSFLVEGLTWAARHGCP